MLQEVNMSGVIRREFELSTEQSEFLRRRSREIGVTEDELLRRAIDAIRSEHEVIRTRQRAWNHLKSMMEERAQMDVPQTGRTWTREDLYDVEGRH
jgi:hypothetical protein